MAQRRLMWDLIVFIASLGLAAFIISSDLTETLLRSVQTNEALVSFVAGIFFTTIATTAPAIAVLGSISVDGNIYVVALAGALGAVVGDYLLFSFVRDRISGDVEHLLSRRTLGRMRALMRRRTFKWFMPFVGGLLIAIPLPTDELGMAILGMTKLPTKLFIPLAFVFNAVGIFLFCLGVRAVS